VATAQSSPLRGLVVWPEQSKEHRAELIAATRYMLVQTNPDIVERLILGDLPRAATQTEAIISNIFYTAFFLSIGEPALPLTTNASLIFVYATHIA
jgi:hypothetical protein